MQAEMNVRDQIELVGLWGCRYGNRGIDVDVVIRDYAGRGPEDRRTDGKTRGQIRKKGYRLREVVDNDLLLSGAVGRKGFGDRIEELLHCGHRCGGRDLAHIDEVRGIDGPAVAVDGHERSGGIGLGSIPIVLGVAPLGDDIDKRIGGRRAGIRIGRGRRRGYRCW